MLRPSMRTLPLVPLLVGAWAVIRRRVGRHETLVSDLISSLPWSCSRLYVADNDDSGGDNNLFVTVSEYDPFLWSDNVRCFGSTGGPEILESCTGLADRMDASESSKTFGPQGLPHDYLTPYTLTAGKQAYSVPNVS